MRSKVSDPVEAAKSDKEDLEKNVLNARLEKNYLKKHLI